MKTAIRAFLLAAIFGAPAALSAQNVPEVTPQDAATHMGEMAKICGHVQAGAYFEGRAESPTILRVGGTYPYERINVVINGVNRGKFSPVPEELFRGKDICATGTIDFYDGSATIVVDEPAQIEVQE